MNITIISGSSRRESVTVRIAKFLFTYFQQQYPQHSFQLLNLQEHQLPFVENVWTSVEQVPAEFRPLAEKMFAADAFVLVTPEYNGSCAPAMRNLFDHFPKQTKKTFGIVTASDGAMGGIRAAVGLQNQICAWFGVPCPYMLVIGQMQKKFDAEGQLIDASFSNSIHTFTNEFIWQAEAVYSKKVSA